MIEYFDSNCFDVEDKISDGAGVLDLIAERVHKSMGDLSPGLETIRTSFEQREKMGSTAFGDAYAIPHCRLEGAGGFVTGVLKTSREIAFGSKSGKGTRLFVYMAGPREERAEHIRVLSRLAGLLSDRKCVDSLLHAENKEKLKEAVYAFFEDDDESRESGGRTALFSVFLNDETVLQEVLSVFAGCARGNVRVIQTEKADSYLYKMPLFSAYWTDQGDSFGRMVIAAVPHAGINDAIRRLTVKEDGSRRRISIAVQELSFFLPETL